MANSWFQFKQFRVDQDKSAMKVSTDACILGAFTPIPEKGFILDIGTGTGLLALMMAQRSSCEIDAVEFDEESYQQAEENVANSKWSERIDVHFQDIRVFSSSRKYALIICNPPFFEKHLKSPSEKKNLARHSTNLALKELITIVTKLLDAKGLFSVLLPEKQMMNCIELATGLGLYLQLHMLIKDNLSGPVIRSIGIFSSNAIPQPETRIMLIKDQSNNYSEEFQSLLSPFYLNL